jgi:hypothetical protein
MLHGAPRASRRLFLSAYAEDHGLCPWMNAERVPFEALKERSRICLGGFRPMKDVEGPRLRAVTHFGVQARALARGAPFFEESLGFSDHVLHGKSELSHHDASGS